ncbi:MAG: HAMP domain-containing sensor histidine kinase [Nitriliruptoraceae bacterium]
MRAANLPLRRRVTVTGTLVVAVLVLVLDVFVYVSLRDRMLSNLERVLDAREQLVEGLDQELGPEEIADRLDSAGVRAVVRTVDGVEYRSGGAPALNLIPPAEAEEPLASRMVPLSDGAVAFVLASRGGIETTLNRLVVLAGTGTVVVIGLAIAVFAWLSSRVLQPVREVASTAQHIAQGHLDQRLDAKGDDAELSEMVRTFNGMLDALEAALERSREAEQVSRRFLADAAHQLRTPAAGIRASVGATLRTPEGPDREQLLDNLAQESARMARLLSSLLRVARLDSQEPPTFEHSALDELLAGLVERHRARAPWLTFELETASDVWAEVDVGSLHEAVDNLLENAVRHAAGRVLIRLEAAEDAVTIRVSDDGPGVAAADAETIFDRFVTRGDGAGTGLGLPIARGIAVAHGGSLVYAEGGFVLRLPRDRPTVGQT